MKIYNTKTFASGIFMIALGTLNLVMCISDKDLNIRNIILAAALYLLGSSAVVRSLSRKMAKADRLEELDERNRLIELKAKSKSFQITQTICFILLIGTMAAAKLTGYEEFVGIALGLAFAYAISMFTNLFTIIYYEQHN